MGDWEDLCESLGLTAAAEWDDVAPFLCIEEPENLGPPRRVLPAAVPSERNRPLALSERVEAAFRQASIDPPCEAEPVQYAYRFSLRTGGRFDLYFSSDGRPSTFAFLRASMEERAQIRTALQLNLSRPCPAEMRKWNLTRERLMRDKSLEQGWKGLWIDHKPLKTLVVLRRTRYSREATHPAYDKSKRIGVVVLQHHESDATTVLSRHGDLELQSRIVDGLIAFGLIDVPGSQSKEQMHV